MSNKFEISINTKIEGIAMTLRYPATEEFPDRTLMWLQSDAFTKQFTEYFDSSDSIMAFADALHTMGEVVQTMERSKALMQALDK